MFIFLFKGVTWDFYLNVNDHVYLSLKMNNINNVLYIIDCFPIY